LVLFQVVPLEERSGIIPRLCFYTVIIWLFGLSKK